MNAIGTPVTSGTGTGEDPGSAGERENEDTMIIDSVSYAFSSGITVSAYVAWDETEQTGALYDTDDATTPNYYIEGVGASTATL